MPHEDTAITHASTAVSLRLGGETRALRFEDLGIIGTGGMGTVHRVRDTRLHREVAMKVLDPSLASRPDMLECFREEARVTGLLEHPNIVPIHELGADSAGREYFTMTLIVGTTLRVWLEVPDRMPGTWQRLVDGLEAFMKVCDAVAFAHERGVVHCDLKPDNVMVDEYGHVYVVDWGLAALRTSESGVPVAVPRANAGGTPGYMPPEQALGDVAAISAQTDIWALGAILYYVVSGVNPVRASALSDAMAMARAGEFTPIDEAAGGAVLPEGLRRIVIRAMQRDPVARYRSVADLRAEVQRYLRGGLYLPAVRFETGAVLVREGEPGDSAYVITGGRCIAFVTYGRDRVLQRRIGPGEVFGETAVLTASARRATVIAVTGVTAILVTRQLFEDGLSVDTWLGAFVRTLAQRFSEVDRRIDPAGVTA